MMPHDASWLVRSLGWTLLHFCWQGAVIAVVLWCALQLLSRRSAQQRYAAACFALALLVLLPLITFTQIGIHEYRLATEIQTSAIPSNANLVVDAGDGVQSCLARAAHALDPLLPWILAAWSAGLCVSLIRLSVGLRLAICMAITAVSPASPQLQLVFASLQRRLGLHRQIALLTSALVQVPTVVGWLRPVVLLPLSCFTGLDDTQIEAILCHELAHIRRHDYLISVLQSVVEAVLFYHPAVWWVSQQVRRERECCCDDLAVTIGGNALAYAKALSTLETRRNSYPEVVLGSNGGVLTMRIKRLLHCEEVSVVPQIAAIVVLAMLTIAAGAIVGTARAQAVPAAPVMTAVAALAPVETRPLMPLPSAVRVAKPAPAAAAIPAAVVVAAVAPEPPQPQAAPGQAVRIAGGVIAGQIVSKVAPIYPAEAKAACIHGAVILHALIGKTGDVEQLQVVSGPPELQTSALDAVRQWKYKPYLLNGEPTAVDTTITINYNFGDASRCSSPQNGDSGAAGAEPKTIGGSVSAPVVLSAPAPEYSAEAKAANISGTVLVSLQVDEQGTPTHVRVVRGVGNGLDEKAVEAVERYHFKPAMENGKPVVVALNIEVQFKTF
jgi:TonB family protein